MTQTQRKRLRRFVNYLNNLRTQCFNINDWCASNSNDIHSMERELSLGHKCGTTACAIGHLPLFNPKVFAYKPNTMKFGGKYNYIIIHKDSLKEDVEAFCEYFGTDIYETIMIFNPYHDEFVYKNGKVKHIRNNWNKKVKDFNSITPKMVAEEIEKKWLSS